MIGRNLLPRRPGRRYERKTKRPGSRYRTRKPGAAEPQNPIRSAVDTIFRSFSRSAHRNGQLLVLIAVAAGRLGCSRNCRCGTAPAVVIPGEQTPAPTPVMPSLAMRMRGDPRPSHRLIRPFLSITKSLEVHGASWGNRLPPWRNHLITSHPQK